ncbi:hypothetical protein [Ruegeria sp.]|uniref:hypothetical protein n=1 Tax=Ruegeria sp. TaxID=1879320 RepID=UPI003B5BF496
MTPQTIALIGAGTKAGRIAAPPVEKMRHLGRDGVESLIAPLTENHDKTTPRVGLDTVFEPA